MPDVLFTVPYPEHSHFVGREDDLARLHAALQGEGPVGINPAVLGNPTGVTGQGGIGKTQLAVAYAYRYRAEYPDGVYWINAAEELRLGFAALGQHLLGLADTAALKRRIFETLRTGYSEQELRDLCFQLDVHHEEFARSLGLSPLAREITEYFERRSQLARLEGAIRRTRGDLAQPQAQDEQIIHAFDWLRNHPNALLILDNLAAPAALDESVIRDCVPGRLPGRLLFTTRRRDLGRFQPVELKTLPPDAALRLLLRDPRRQPALDPAHREHSTARDICETFGYLPLALEIAAAHLAKYSTAPLAAYRDELRRRGARDVMADGHVNVETRHKTGLDAALEAQWATLGQEAQTLLRVAGQLPEAAYLPVARLGLLAGVPEEGQSFFDVTLAGVLDELNGASLIEELAGDEARLHPLVRDFARDRTPLGEKAAFRAECVRRLLDAFGDIETLERQCDRRGIDALIRDLLAAGELLDEAGAPDIGRDLQAQLRVLRREAHNLRGWRRDDAPGFLAQQLQLRLFDSATPALFGDLAARLRSTGWVWRPRWAARRESPALELTLAGHSHVVRAVAVTPDGRRAVSASDDGTLKVWDLATGRVERTLEGHKGGVTAVALTPDGRVISGWRDGAVRVWDLATGQAQQTLVGHGEWVTAVAVTRDGRRVVSASGGGMLKVWNLATGQPECTLAGHKRWVTAVALTPDEGQVVSASGDGTVRVWDLATGQAEQTLEGHVNSVNAVAVTVTPDGWRAVSASGDRTLKVWDLATGQAEQTLEGHTHSINAVAVTPDGRQAVSASGDGTLKVWDLATGQVERTLAGHASGVTAVAVTRDGRRAVSASGDGTLKVWDLATRQAEQTLEGHESLVWAVATTRDGHRAVSASFDGTLKVWDLATGQVERTLEGHASLVRAVATTRDGHRAVSASRDSTLKVWDLATGQAERTLAGHTNSVNAVAVTPDGQRAVSASDDGTLKVWDLATGQAERTLESLKDQVRAVAVTPDGWVVSGWRDGTVRVWDLVTGQAEQTLARHEDQVNAVAVTSDRRAVSASDDGTLKVWDLATGQVERTLEGHKRWVRAVAVMPDERRAVSASADGTLRLWDLDAGRKMAHVALDAALWSLAVVPGQPPVVVAGDAVGNVYCLEWVE